MLWWTGIVASAFGDEGRPRPFPDSVATGTGSETTFQPQRKSNMPRRNIAVLMIALVVCLACAMRASRSGQIIQFAMLEIQRKALEPKPEKELLENALHGMVDSLDPYSAYIDSKQLQRFEEDLDQEFAGIGVEVYLDPETEQITVACPLVGTPAYEAGIKPGDRITAIEGESTEGWTLEEASDKLRGEPGTPVRITLSRPGHEEPIELTIVRQIIQVDTVIGDTRNADGSWEYVLQEYPQIGYIRLTTFADATDEQLADVLTDLERRGIEGLILDLRNNPGGRLDVAVAVADLFLESGVIVTTRYRDGTIKQQYAATPGSLCRDVPMVVLVNGESASASEIVAACLQDHARAVVAGERSFGKGTVQELILLPTGLGEIKLTTASYWRPSGKNIHRHEGDDESAEWGVLPEPDLERKLDDDEFERWYRNRALRDFYRAEGAPLPEGFEGVCEARYDPQLDVVLTYLGLQPISDPTADTETETASEPKSPS
ncbi:MAG: S41 family peptidase, partial [Planctomycetota bacterium]